MANGKILVTYASRKGSTAEVAHEIVNVLRATGADVSIQPVQYIHNLIPYDAVVIGSGIYDGSLLPEAMDFIKLNTYTLGKLPVAYFAVSMALAKPNDADIEESRHYLDRAFETAPDVKPLDIGMFAGSYEPNGLRKLVLRFNNTPHGDYRNWAEIREWAATIQPKLERAL
jgi:menaquinone-dependent protoporphyrinogen oxidase